MLGGGGEGRRRRRFAVDGGGSAGEDEDDGLDPVLPAPIAPSRRTRTTRRGRWRARLALGELRSSAMWRRRSAMSRPWHGVARVRGFTGRVRERDSRGSRDAPLCAKGGHGARRRQGRPRVRGGHGASVPPGATVKGREMTGGSHLSGIFLFSFSRNFREL